MSHFIPQPKNQWVRILDSTDLMEATPKALVVGGQAVLLVRHHGHVYGVEDRCPHRDVPLSQGRVVDDCIECPLHGWQFQLANGRGCVRTEAAVATFVVKEEDEAIYLWMG